MKCLAFLIFISGLILSCSKEHRFDARELNLISAEKIEGLDPLHVAPGPVSFTVGKIYEGLFELHPLKRPYELVPNLSENFPSVSKDGLTYTFKIKQGVFFHDSAAFSDGKGRELVAQDFIYSFKRLADPKLKAKDWAVFDQLIKGLSEWRTQNTTLETTNYDLEVEGLKFIDKYTFQIKLTKVYPQLLGHLVMPYTFVVAREVVDHFGKDFQHHPVGTGAFMLAKLEQANRVVFIKNPQFREKFYPSEGETGDERRGLLSDAGKRLPLVDRIIVTTVPESKAMWRGFKRAKFDILELDDFLIQETLKGDNTLKLEYRNLGIRLVAAAQLETSFIAYNHENKIFKDAKVRQAMSLAYDREEAKKLFHRGRGIISQSVIPPGLRGYNQEFKNPFIVFDLVLARKLLEEAGFPEGKGFPEITVEALDETNAKAEVEFFAKCMEKIGITVHLSMNTWPELVNKVTKKQHQMYAMAKKADYPDAENFLGLVYCPNKAAGTHGSHFCNPEIDKMIEEAIVLQDLEERSLKYQAVNEKIAHEVPWIFGFNKVEFSLTQAWVKNYKFMEFNHNQAQYLNVDFEVKKELRKKF